MEKHDPAEQLRRTGDWVGATLLILGLLMIFGGAFVMLAGCGRMEYSRDGKMQALLGLSFLILGVLLATMGPYLHALAKALAELLRTSRGKDAPPGERDFTR